MIALTLGDLAEVVGGRLVDGDPDVRVTGPAFLDSRAPEPGGLFVAFVGERADGHDHAPGAVEGGAAAVLGSRATGVPTVLVGDTQSALQELARVVLARRRARRTPFTVVAVTGSQGKTTAKDMLARVLADGAPTVATAGSFNNELGLPLTVLRTEEETRYLVLEMGARGIGHLAELTAIAPPDVSLVLNVGKAHLGEFGSQEAIARAKGELVEALTPEGTAVLNADDRLVIAMRSRTPARVRTFGTSQDADVRLSAVGSDELGRAVLDLTVEDRTEHVALRLLGEHQAANAAAVTATALAAGRPFEEVCASLRAIERLSRWRMEVLERPDGLMLVNDAYNANPDSMRAALQTLAGIGRRSGRPTTAVLGAMLELGPASEQEHRELGTLAHDLGIDRLVVVGVGAGGVYDALVEARGEDGSALRVDTVDEAGEWLRDNVAGPDVVLIKASRSGRLERVAELIMRAGSSVADTRSHDAPAGEESRR